MFQIYINRDLYQRFKKFVWKLNSDFVLRLGGVQLKLDKDKKLALNPVYYPLFSWKDQADMKELTIYFPNVAYIFRWKNGFYIYKDIDRSLREEK